MAESIPATMSTQVYKLIIGGPQSDRCLHGTATSMFQSRVPGQDVLDTGCGDGRFSKKLVGLRPRSLLITDYDMDAPGRVISKLRAEMDAPDVHLVGKRLDVASDFAVLEGQKFDRVFCLSVLMHVGQTHSEQAIYNLSRHLNPGGSVLLATMSHRVACELYIPARSKGDGWYYPQLKGLAVGATEDDVLQIPGAHVLAEFYPPDEHYLQAAQRTGLRVRECPAYAGEECKGSIYERYIGSPLWQMLEISV